VLAAVTLLALTVAPLALAAGGSPRLQVFFQANLESADYQKKIFDRVAKTWRQPGPKQRPQPGKKTIVQAIVSKDGKLVSSSVAMESGARAWDAAALAAVKRAAPFPPLPKGYNSPTLEVHFHLGWVAEP
jgi:protein TonB